MAGGEKSPAQLLLDKAGMNGRRFAIAAGLLGILGLSGCGEQTNDNIEDLPFCPPEYIEVLNKIVLHDRQRTGFSADVHTSCVEFSGKFDFGSRCLARNLKTHQIQAVDGYTAQDICRNNDKVNPLL